MSEYIVIGAGPSGLTIGRELALRHEHATVLEADPQYIGGIARTVEYVGFYLDLGGHRFYTRNQRVHKYWNDILQDDFLTVKRTSRILHNGNLIPYPLELRAVIRHLGPIESFRCLLGYLQATAFPERPIITMEDWFINAFGKRLYQYFFKDFTEKVWNLPCNKISKDWGGQRIRALSLHGVLKDLVGIGNGSTSAKSLIREFQYPRLGAKQLWHRMRDDIIAGGSRIMMGRRVTSLRHRNHVVRSVVTDENEEYTGTHFFSSMPISELIQCMEPAPPAAVVAAARSLKYRGFIQVAIILKQSTVFSEQWLYINTPNAKVCRIQNFKNWNPAMVPDSRWTCLGMEYFCSPGDDLWNQSDSEWIGQAAKDIEATGIASADDIVDACIVRVSKAYPLYDLGYKCHRTLVKEWLCNNVPNLTSVGRFGHHNYNSMDHAVLAGIQAVENLLDGAEHDIWRINTTSEYAEDDTVSN